MSQIRIETGIRAVLTRVYIDDVEVRGVTRVWVDSGDVDGGDRPRRAWRDTTRVHLEVITDRLLVSGVADVDILETVPVREKSA